jgi:hypothetical protein
MARRRSKSGFYQWYPEHECYLAAWSPCDEPPGTRRIERVVLGLCGSGRGCVALEVTEFEGFNGLWHVPHNEVFRIEHTTTQARR